MRKNNPRHIETLLRKTAEAQTKEVQTHKNPVEQRRQTEPRVSNRPAENTPLATANEMNELGWSFRNRTTKVSPIRTFDELAAVESPFADRLAATLDVSSLRHPSVIQR